jgi:hypothetical protein
MKHCNAGFINKVHVKLFEIVLESLQIWMSLFMVFEKTELYEQSEENLLESSKYLFDSHDINTVIWWATFFICIIIEYVEF